MFENYQLDLAAGNGMTKNSSSHRLTSHCPEKDFISTCMRSRQSKKQLNYSTYFHLLVDTPTTSNVVDIYVYL